MPGGRPRKSLAILESSGATAKNPQRFRDRGPDITVEQSLGEAPEAWVLKAQTSPEYAKLVKAWERITSRLAMLPAGVVTGADDLMVELACRLLVRIDGGYAKNSDYSQYRAILNDLGLTARGRAARSAPQPHGDLDDGDFGEFIRKPARRSA